MPIAAYPDQCRRRFTRLGLGAAAVALVAGLLGASGAAAATRTGDRCQAFGAAGSYTLQITIPHHAPVQRSLAFATPGTSITNLDIPGGDGAPSTSDLPPGTNAQWVFAAPPPSGVLTVSMQTTGRVTGSFTVDPGGKTAKVRYASFACAVAAGGPSRAFAVNAHPPYDPTAHAWEDTVTAPSAGTVTFLEVFTPTGTPLVTKGAPPAQLIEPGLTTVTKPGTAVLMLQPSPAGSSALGRSGSITLYLSVSFRPAGGLPSTKILHLVLHR